MAVGGVFQWGNEELFGTSRDGRHVQYRVCLYSGYQYCTGLVFLR